MLSLNFFLFSFLLLFSLRITQNKRRRKRAPKRRRKKRRRRRRRFSSERRRGERGKRGRKVFGIEVFGRERGEFWRGFLLFFFVLGRREKLIISNFENEKERKKQNK